MQLSALLWRPGRPKSCNQNDKYKMTLVSSDDLFDYYETRLNNIYPRLCYYFALKMAIRDNIIMKEDSVHR